MAKRPCLSVSSKLFLVRQPSPTHAEQPQQQPQVVVLEGEPGVAVAQPLQRVALVVVRLLGRTGGAQLAQARDAAALACGGGVVWDARLEAPRARGLTFIVVLSAQFFNYSSTIRLNLL